MNIILSASALVKSPAGMAFSWLVSVLRLMFVAPCESTSNKSTSLSELPLQGVSENIMKDLKPESVINERLQVFSTILFLYLNTSSAVTRELQRIELVFKVSYYVKYDTETVTFGNIDR